MVDRIAKPYTPLLSERALRTGVSSRLGDPRASAARISFFAGFPDPASLPQSDISEATRVALERDGEWALQYGAPRGYPGLIDELVTKLARDQGIETTPDHILITNGASQALALITDMLVNPGDVVLSESPTWMGAVRNFRSAGAVVREVPLDDDGTDVEALAAILDDLRSSGSRAKLLYVIPNFHNPTGVTTTLERRRRIVALAREHQVPIVEDDAYSDLRYAGDRQPTLYTLAQGELVMYMGTFSKIMAAGMRLGWVVAAPDVIAQLVALKFEGGTSPFAGHVAAEFCSSGTLVEHVQELRQLYRRRRDVMLRTLEREMPEGTTWTSPEGGFFTWMTLPDGVSATAMAPLAYERNVEYLVGTACYYHGEGDNRIRLSFSFANEEQIERGVRILGDLIREQLAASSSHG